MPDEQPVQPHAAFAELSHLRLAEHTLEGVLDKIVTLAKRTLPAASEVSVTVVDGGRPTTAAFTGRLARDLDERQYERGHGPCLDAITQAHPVRVTDMDREQRWPDWSAEASRAGARSVLSVPVRLHPEVFAGVNIYSTTSGAFGDEDITLATTFATYAGVALANIHLYEKQSRLAEDLQTAMRMRAVIEQAKGILMGSRRCSADEAFDLLVKLSQDSHRKLRDVAQAVVDEAAG